MAELRRSAEVMRYHDFHLRGYSVTESGRRIELHLAYDYPGSTESDSHILFSDVACYRFSHTESAIITDLEEVPLRDFVKKEEEFLVAAAVQDGLRLWRSDAPDYLRQLEEGGYHAWRLDSAIGFSGFVVAKAVREKEAPNQSPEPTRFARGSS